MVAFTHDERCAYGLIHVLARLHGVDPHTVGLDGFGRPAGYLARQVRRWRDQWQRACTRTLHDVDELHARLTDVCPPESGMSIAHGDYRIDNAIQRRSDTRRVILHLEECAPSAAMARAAGKKIAGVALSYVASWLKEHCGIDQWNPTKASRASGF
jgi:phosphotransferase family enzyme